MPGEQVRFMQVTFEKSVCTNCVTHTALWECFIVKWRLDCELIRRQEVWILQQSSHGMLFHAYISKFNKTKQTQLVSLWQGEEQKILLRFSNDSLFPLLYQHRHPKASIRLEEQTGVEVKHRYCWPLKTSKEAQPLFLMGCFIRQKMKKIPFLAFLLKEK